MTNFTAFAFPATGAPTLRTVPTRLAEIHNVKDFGATGDGVTDDLVAIRAAINWQIANDRRGTIYFPPGTYYVSAPIDYGTSSDGDPGLYVSFAGEMGLSTIVGDFNDYVLKRGIDSTPRWGGPWFAIERLKILNRYAGGGGIRIGASQGVAIRDCDVTADVAINDDNTSAFIDGGNTNGSFEIVIENCNVRPYNTLRAGSFGIYKLSDGPVTNCTITGFDVGMGTASGQGGAAVHGCYFEGNNVGFAPGRGIEAWAGSGGNFTAAGCRFKNNGIAIYPGSGGGEYRGIFIEATAGSIPGDPQYGIKILGDLPSRFEGVLVTGNYAVAGIYIQGGEAIRHLNKMTAVSSINTGAGVNWSLPGSAGAYNSALTTRFQAVNFAPVYAVNGLPAVTAPITSASWSSAGGGTITVNFTSPVDVSNLTSKSANLTVSGVTPSGYNVTAVGTVINFAQIQFPLASNPGAYVPGGIIFFTGADASVANAFEGDTYNVSDANTSIWGAAVTGGGSNHVKVRLNGTKWTVVGK